MSSTSLSPLLLLLLLSLAPLTLCISWEEERLQWLTVTSEGVANVKLSCASQHIYPFTLLNDTDNVGVGREIESVSWLLPNSTLAGVGYNDGNRRVLSNGVELLVATVNNDVYGLYHCVVVTSNGTTSYYKRGLNLYGPDLYGGNGWLKYRGNLLTGCLSAGTFLALLGGYMLLRKFGFGAAKKTAVEPTELEGERREKEKEKEEEEKKEEKEETMT